jgi:hypothetical protein
VLGCELVELQAIDVNQLKVTCGAEACAGSAGAWVEMKFRLRLNLYFGKRRFFAKSISAKLTSLSFVFVL